MKRQRSRFCVDDIINAEWEREFDEYVNWSRFELVLRELLQSIPDEHVNATVFTIDEALAAFTRRGYCITE